MKRKAHRARRIHGHKALDYAYRHNVGLHKYADPIEGARSGLRFDEAYEIAKVDPSLIYAKVKGARRAHGRFLNSRVRRSR
jgi:hypothetical protein